MKRDRRPRFRVIDTGLDDGRRNIAFDQALIDLRRADRIPDTIRFLRFRPTALVGRHQALSGAVDTAYCREHDIAIGRRVTGGGALYLDEAQLGWELVFDRRSLNVGALADVTRAICEAAAAGLSGLGIEARFRPRNDLEVGGRKIGGTGGFFDGPILFYQGTVLLDLDPSRLLGALRVPGRKFEKHGAASAADRVTTLRDLLGDAAPGASAVQAALITGFERSLGIAVGDGEPGPLELDTAAALYDEDIGTDAFVYEIDRPADADEACYASRDTDGGTIEVWLRLARGMPARVESVFVTGDFFVTPPRVVADLEASLKDVPVDALAEAVDAFFRRAELDAMSTGTGDIASAILDAAEQALARRAA